MTMKQCQRKLLPTVNKRMCEAFVKAGLTLDQVTSGWISEIRGFSAKELAALNKYYNTNLEPMGECSPTCVMCHEELYDRSTHDGLKH